MQEEGEMVHVVDVPQVMHCCDQDRNVGAEKAAAYDGAVDVLLKDHSVPRGNRAIVFLQHSAHGLESSNVIGINHSASFHSINDPGSVALFGPSNLVTIVLISSCLSYLWEPIRLVQLRVWFLRGSIKLKSLFVSWFGSAPYYTKFSPNRSFTIKSSYSSRKIKINVFEPPEFNPDLSKKYPVYLNFHGSAFIIPALGTDADFCRIVSNRTGAIVLDCDYAKAPEWPFPAASEDVKDAIGHVLANKQGYFDISRIAVGGFSVGGTLALTAGVSQPKGVIKGIIAMYPATDLSIDHRTRTLPYLSEGNSNNLPLWLLHLGYINADVSAFPERMLWVVCEEDLLCNEAVGLAEKLKAEGIQVNLKKMPNMVHAWDKQARERTPAGAARHEAYEAAVDTLMMIFGG
ncbi:hypothetical protein OPQ81_003091 [Rhizoctonia solani]|nr:hypothetical protein OPQ81_003091 [Rhizoctonia solani]